MKEQRQYRGKRENNKTIWAKGWYWYDPFRDIHFIKELVEGGTKLCDTPVIPDTVGQSTDVKDKNKKEIYGGDIIRWNGELFSIEYREGSFSLINAAGKWDGYLMVAGSDRIEIIGSK